MQLPRHNALKLHFFSRFAVLLVAIGIVFSAVPASTSYARELTVETITEQLAAKFQNVIDLSARVRFVQRSPRNGSQSDGEIQLKAIFPGLIRAAWTSPDLLRGLLWIVDTQNDRLTQYEPTTGEAHHHSLEEALGDYAFLPLSPEQIFSLPSSQQYTLEITEQPSDKSNGEKVYAQVRAIDKKNGAEYRLWIDVDDWIVQRIESVHPSGTIELEAWVQNLHINQGLTAADLRALPPGTRERSIP